MGHGFADTIGVAVDASGDVFVVDSSPSNVFEIKANCSTNCQTIVGSGLTGPTAVAVDGAGDVFLSDDNVVEVPAGHAVGSSTTLPVQLTNSGQTPLNISNIGIGGTDAGDFSQSNNCPVELSASMSCTISVTFDPMVKGARTGALFVTDNVAAGQSTVALTGTGH